jgi:hypothetical protein
VIPAERIRDDVGRVHELADRRDALRAPLVQLWPRFAQFDTPNLQAWASATLELSEVNAGPSCILAFWHAAAAADVAEVHLVLAGARAAAEICRHAGAKAALTCLDALPTALRLTQAGVTGTGPAELAAWWRGLHRLARAAPNMVAGVADRIETLLAGGDGFGFLDFVAAGLKATANDKARRARFFTLDDELAQAWLLRRAGGGAGFAEAERMLSAFVTGLWGGASRLQAGSLNGPRRAMIGAGTVVLPPVYPGAPALHVRALYRATAAHGYAHLAVPPVRASIGSLKPLQIALIGLVEDARVEALALRQAPGLRALWAQFHVAAPGGLTTAEGLMARLARALLDPTYADDDGFVAKGRALFAAAQDRLDDAGMSRAIGGLLGNDLGQMRLPFNSKTYVVEPAYRDDNMHLWEMPDTPDDALSLTVDAARGRDGDGATGPGEGTSPQRARDGGLDDRGAVLAVYPEWDAVAGVERPDWTILRDHVPRLRPPSGASAREAALQVQIARLIRASPIGQQARQARREAGEALDLDAVIDAATARRACLPPDARIYRDRRLRGRDLATLIIVDASQSTAAVDETGQSVLAAQQIAVEALAAALSARGDPYAVRAFASAGREDVRLTRIKDFDESLSPAVLARLAGLTPGLSTRLGAALRHSGAELALIRTSRKLVLVLTDGEPSDIDVPDPHELVEDARRAARGLRQSGVDTFGIVMDPQNAGSAATIFGRHNAMPVTRLADLPAKLSAVYFRLAQR